MGVAPTISIKRAFPTAAAKSQKCLKRNSIAGGLAIEFSRLVVFLLGKYPKSGPLDRVALPKFRTDLLPKNKRGDPKVAPSEKISLFANSLSQLSVVVLLLGRELHP